VSGTVVLSGASNSYYEVVVEYKAVGAAYGCTLRWQSFGFPLTVLFSEFSVAISHVKNSPLLLFVQRTPACNSSDCVFLIIPHVIDILLQLFAHLNQSYYLDQQYSLIRVLHLRSQLK
jgi:hypothetical protein